MGDVHISADFPTGSAGSISWQDDLGVIQPKPEPVPEWFYDALQENFGGAGVPREYAFHVRVSSENKRSIRLGFPFTTTNGAGYMDPPYWIQRDGIWNQAAESDTVFVPGSRAEILVNVNAGETIQVANKPYPSLESVYTELDELAHQNGFLTSTVYGKTEEGRPLVALQTEPRQEKILINATMQPAEPAAKPVLAVAHWLADRSAIANRMRDRFQFCMIPLPNPDGSFHGRSVTNAIGEVPMFSFGRHLAGEATPNETARLWEYLSEVRPAAHIEFHTHYQDTRFHKLNPLALEWFPKSMHDRVKETTRSLLAVNDQWRVTELVKDMPIVTAGKFVNMAMHFQTISYCYQIYALTETSTCTQAIAAVQALANGLAGKGWASERREPEIVKG